MSELNKQGGSVPDVLAVDVHFPETTLQVPQNPERVRDAEIVTARYPGSLALKDEPDPTIPKPRKGGDDA